MEISGTTSKSHCCRIKPFEFCETACLLISFTGENKICFCSSDSLSTCPVLTCLLSIFLYELKQFSPMVCLNLISLGLESSLQTIEYA